MFTLEKVVLLENKKEKINWKITLYFRTEKLCDNKVVPYGKAADELKNMFRGKTLKQIVLDSNPTLESIAYIICDTLFTFNCFKVEIHDLTNCVSVCYENVGG